MATAEIALVRPNGAITQTLKEEIVAKPEWGTKRQCPACGARFYDLGKADPVVCLKCATAFEPEVLLKPRRQRPDDKPAAVVKAVVLADADEEDLEINADLDTVSLEELEVEDTDADDPDAVIASIPGLGDEDLADGDADDDTLLETVDDDDDDILPIPGRDD